MTSSGVKVLAKAALIAAAKKAAAEEDRLYTHAEVVKAKGRLIEEEAIARSQKQLKRERDGQLKSAPASQADTQTRNRAKNPTRPAQLSNRAVVFNEFPAIVGNEVRGAKMKVTVGGDGSWKRVVHRVQIATTAMPSGAPLTFTELQRISLQPGSGALGQWVADEATHWEQWKIGRANIIWVPSVGTTTPGDVTLTVDYDAYDGPVTSNVVASDNQDTVIGSIFEPHRLTLDCKAVMQQSQTGYKFVRSGADYMGDRREYDGGTMSICIEGVAASAGTLLGKLWMEFDIMFRIPQDPSEQRTFNSRTCTAYLASTVGTVTLASTVPWTITENQIGITTESSGTILVCPPGRYYVEAEALIQSETVNTSSSPMLEIRDAAATASSPIALAYAGVNGVGTAAQTRSDTPASTQVVMMTAAAFFQISDAQVTAGENKITVTVGHLSGASPLAVLALTVPLGPGTTSFRPTTLRIMRVDH